MELLVSIFGVICLATGFFVGYNIADKKKLPEVNPVKIIEKVKEQKEVAKKEKETKEKFNQLNDILDNINRYDGTGASQKPIKKG